MTAAAPAGSTDAGRVPARRAPRRRRRVAWLVVGLLLLVIVLVGADRIAEVVVSRRLAARIQTTQHLSTRPDVTIHGFPFLSQVVRGNYGDVTISARSPIVEDGVELDDVNARLNDVHVTTSDAIHGTVRKVPVRSGRATALVTYPQLTGLLRRYAGGLGGAVSVVGGAAGHARIDGPLGLSLDVTAQVTSGKLTVVPDPQSLQGLPDILRSVVTDALSSPIPLPAFPFNVHLTSAQLRPDGVHLMATASNSVFPV